MNNAAEEILYHLQMNMVNVEDLYESNYITFDIETVRKTNTWEELSEYDKIVWHNLVTRQKAFEDDSKKGRTPEEIYIDKGGLFPEFLTVCAISFGIMKNGIPQIATLTLNDGTEKQIISKFGEILNSRKDVTIVGFNCVNFDIDVLYKKMIFYGIKIPKQLDLRNVKPWDAQVYDIYLKWKGTRYDIHPSLMLVSNFLGVGVSKDVMNGSEVSGYYWVDDLKLRKKNIKLIGEYCSKDVDVTMKVFEILRKI
jgi:DNA polymerase elongation subunit (family B)